MTKSLIVSLAFAFLLLCCLSCQEEPTAVQSDLSSQEDHPGLGKVSGAGPRDRVRPTIEYLRILNPDGLPNAESRPVGLPSGGVVIKYKVSDNVGIAEVQMGILYDQNKDGVWEIMFTERPYTDSKTFDLPMLIDEGQFVWDGTVTDAYSNDGNIFDHLASDQPDVYLVTLWVSDGQSAAWNYVENLSGEITTAQVIGSSAIQSRIFVEYTNAQRPEFHIIDVETPQPTGTLKGKYPYALAAKIKCSASDFRGAGMWMQVDPSTRRPVRISNYSGCPTCQFLDYGAGVATTNTLAVGPGTYRYYVELVYGRSNSYLPTEDVETYAEIQVP